MGNLKHIGQSKARVLSEEFGTHHIKERNNEARRLYKEGEEKMSKEIEGVVKSNNEEVRSTLKTIMNGCHNGIDGLSTEQSKGANLLRDWAGLSTGEKEKSNFVALELVDESEEEPIGMDFILSLDGPIGETMHVTPMDKEVPKKGRQILQKEQESNTKGSKVTSLRKWKK
jgi:hypothetical protein